MERIYFDYNIYNLLSKDKLKLPERYSQYAKVYVSVAHAEEYYNAYSNDADGNNRDHLEYLLLLFTKLLNNSGILNPTLNRIINKSEKFSDVLERVKTFDTRDSISQGAKYIYANQKDAYELIKTIDKTSINNSNLSYKDIWQRPEVIAELNKCDEERQRHNREAPQALQKDYGWFIAHLIARNTLIKPFALKKGLFKGERPNFVQLEFLVEFLQNVLNNCGYHRDKTIKTVNSGIYDTEHAIYASYCNFFVTNDNSLKNRMNAIYYYLGLPTKCCSFDEWSAHISVQQK